MKKIIPFIILIMLVIILIIIVVHNKKIDIEENYTRIIMEVISENDYKLSTEKYVFKNGKYTYTKNVTYSNNEDKNERESKSGKYIVENKILIIDDEEWQIKDDRICHKDCSEEFFTDSKKDENIIIKNDNKNESSTEGNKNNKTEDSNKDYSDQDKSSNNKTENAENKKQESTSNKEETNNKKQESTSNKKEETNNQKQETNKKEENNQSSEPKKEGSIINIKSINEYKNAETVTFIVIARSNCSHCVTYKETITNVVKKYPVNIYYLDMLKVDNSVIASINNDYNITGTPTTLIFKNGEYIDELVGKKSEETLISQLKKYKKIS